MKKFNPEAELSRVQKRNNVSFNSSKMSNMFIPFLVVGCSMLAMVGITFSTKLAVDDKDIYSVNVQILNGKIDEYKANILEGAFSDKVEGNGTFGSISCSTGELEYDSLTSTLYSPYLNENANCVIAFMDDGIKKIDANNMYKINDNTGVSYYYKKDATNNYFKFDNKMFRIVRVNGDGTIRIMLDDVVLSSIYGKYNEYYASDLKVTLENWYNTKISKAAKEYVVLADYDFMNYVNYDIYNLINVATYELAYVGTLNVREAELMSTDVNGKDDFLDTVNGMYLNNGNAEAKVFYYNDSRVLSTTPDKKLSVRPVINIKNVTLSGSGDKTDPYVISE